MKFTMASKDGIEKDQIARMKRETKCSMRSLQDNCGFKGGICEYLWS